MQQYLAMSFRILALVASGFAIQSALRIHTEEAAGRAEPVLATPVSRTRWAMSHLVLAVGGSALVLALVGAAFGLSDAVVTSDPGAIGDAFAGAIAFLPAVWVLVGLVVALVGLVPRATVAVWGALGACFVIGMFGQVLGVPTWVQDLSPFQHVPRYPAATFELVPLAFLVLLAAGLTTLGLAALRHRDLS